MNGTCVDKIIVSADECATGMRLMQSIVDEKTGTTIVARGQILNDEHISKLKNFKHTEIWVRIEEESNFWKVASTTIEQYQNYASILKRVFCTQEKSLSYVELNQLRELSKMIVKNFKSDYDALGCMGLLSHLDKNIYYHSINVALLALLVGRWMKYDSKKIEDLVMTGLLHDVGKIKINPSLYNKREEEMGVLEKLEYRRHTIHGYEMLVTYNELDNEILKGVLSHHECIDGSGYPLCVDGEHLNDFAKIIGIVDTFDRLKEKYHIFKTIRHLGSIRFKKFDPEILLPFCRNVVNYYIGCKVLLSNGKIGEIAFIEPKALYRPIVRVGEQEINLYEQPSIEIVKVF